MTGRYQDVKTRLVAGLYVTIGEPSWDGGMGCVANIAADKVEFCRQYDIDIRWEDWPCNHIGDEYLADGGEFKGYNSDAIPENLGSLLSNTGSYRADLKGPVERDFLAIDQELINDLPGAKPPMLKRGEKDSGKAACLTVKEFIQAVIHRVIAYNTRHRLSDDYPMTSDMIKDHVLPYPADLWIWGLANEGKPREMEIDRVHAALLPRGKAVVTEYGIRFGKLGYDSTYARKHRLFAQARVTKKRHRNRGARSTMYVQVVFEPRLVDVIYLIVKEGGVERLEACNLRPRYRTFRGRSWRDVEHYFKNQRSQKIAARQEERQAQAAKDVAVTALVKPAAERKRSALAEAFDGPRRPRLGRRAARQEVRRREDQQNAWRLPGARSPSDSTPAPEHVTAQTPSAVSTKPSAAEPQTPKTSWPPRPIVDVDKYLHALDRSSSASLEVSQDNQGK